MKKKGLWALAALVALALLAAALYAPDYGRALEFNWDISLPAAARFRQIYQKDSGASFHGDGIRYHVFSYQYEDFTEEMFAWAGPHQRHATRYYGSLEEAAQAWLDEIDVPADRRPDYAACDHWNGGKNGNCEIIFFRDTGKNELYILEFLT